MADDVIRERALAGAALIFLAACSAPDGFYGQTLPEAAVMPLIREQPQAQVASEGGTVRFSVDVEGQGLVHYQWRRNGADLPGATEATLVIPDAAAGDDRALYTVVVGNAVARVASRPAELRVAAAPPAPISVSAPSMH
jgi:hypothetical protein